MQATPASSPSVYILPVSESDPLEYPRDYLAKLRALTARYQQLKAEAKDFVLAHAGRTTDRDTAAGQETLWEWEEFRRAVAQELEQTKSAQAYGEGVQELIELAIQAGLRSESFEMKAAIHVAEQELRMAHFEADLSSDFAQRTQRSELFGW